GYLEFHFETEHTFKPKVLEDGTVDYKNLQSFTSVAAGDTLIVRVPPEEGTPGTTVTGKVLEAKRGNEAKLPKGKNAEPTEDGSRMVATRAGRVDYVRGRVEVMDVYAIPGNVDMGVGNVDFIGDVEIQGNVISGLTLKATGSIEVRGTVEAATLIAGKNIVLRKGIQGMDKALLKAEGDIIAQFIERSTVEAGGNVQADYIVHSTVTAQNSVVLRGKRGRLIGGMARAGKQLIAKTIGSPAGERAYVEIGVSPEMREKYENMKEQRDAAKKQIDQISMLAQTQPDPGDTARMEMWQKLMSTLEPLQASYEDLQHEIAELELKFSEMSGGQVHVYGEIYQDVKMVIDNAPYKTQSSINFATFRKRGGEVVFSSCEVEG
ncbi:FapA family protein, partial [Clostridia bacterium OttesenSCG-928-F22]|nr:FapA family protein [Clostridia bacterium OttesenSCG-928-F22]